MLILRETAELAKELEFNQPCETAYNTKAFSNRYANKVEGEFELGGYCNNNPILLSLPNQSQLQKWLRDEHNLHIEIYVTHVNKLTCKLTQYNWKLKKLNVKNKMQTRKSGYCHNSYEEALEEALLFTLKYMKKNGQNTKSN